MIRYGKPRSQPQTPNSGAIFTGATPPNALAQNASPSAPVAAPQRPMRMVHQGMGQVLPTPQNAAYRQPATIPGGMAGAGGGVGRAAPQDAVGDWYRNGGNGRPVYGSIGGALKPVNRGGGMSPANALMADYNEAKAANEARYQQLLGMNQQGGDYILGDQNTTYGATRDMLAQQRYGQLGFQDQQRGRQMGYLDQQSNADYELERRRRDAEIGNATASLAYRGLSNSTVGDALRRGIIDDSALREARIADQRLGQRMGVEDAYTGRYGGIMSGLDSTGLGLAQRYGDNRNQQLNSLLNQRMAVVEGRSDPYPNASQIYQMLAQGGGQRYYSPSLGMGGGSGGGMGLVRGGRNYVGGEPTGRSIYGGGFNEQSPPPVRNQPPSPQGRYNNYASVGGNTVINDPLTGQPSVLEFMPGARYTSDENGNLIPYYE